MEEVAQNLAGLNLNGQQQQLSLRQKILEREEENYGYLAWYVEHFDENVSRDIKLEIKHGILNSDHLVIDQTIVVPFLFFELLSTKFNLAFISIMLDEKEESENFIASAETTLESIQQYIPNTDGILTKSEEHILGIKIALNSLKEMMNLNFNVQNDIERIQSNNPATKACLKVLEAKFIGEVTRDRAECADTKMEQEIILLVKAISLEQNWEWLFFKCQITRWFRRERKSQRDPVAEELAGLEEALALNKRHPKLLMRELELMAEKLYSTPPWFPLQSFSHTFNDKESFIRHLREKATTFRELYPAPGWLNAFGRIFATNLGCLGWRYRDIGFAITLQQEALNIAPNSSKLNHRMSVFQALNQNFDLAETHARRAVESDANNDPAILDMTKLLLRRRRQDFTPQQLNELEHVFRDEYFEQLNSKLKPSVFTDLLFLKGYYHLFVRQQMGLAITAWIRWARNYREINTSNLSFHTLPGRNRGWTVNPNSQFYQEGLQRVRNELRRFQGNPADANILQRFLSPPRPRYW